MATREQLQAAIDVCGWVCCECGSDQITPMRNGDEWIPNTGHWAGEEWCCPTLTAGSITMLRCWLDVNEALNGAGLPVPHYGAETRYSKREAVTA